MGLRKEKQMQRLAGVAAVCAGFSMQAALYTLSGATHPGDYVKAALGTVLAISFLLTAIILVHIWSLRPADSHTWKSLLFDYFVHQCMVPVCGYWFRKRLESAFEDCEAAQNHLLRYLVTQNKDCVHAQDKQLQGVSNGVELASKLPISTYEHYRAYVDRVLAGEENVLFSAPVVFFALTSGTTGKNKVYPIPKSFYSNVLGAIGMAMTLREKHKDFYRGHGLARRFDFRMFYPNRVSPKGIPMGGLGSMVQRPSLGDLIPACTRKLTKEGAIFYSQAIFALAEREVGFIDGFSSDILLAFFNFIKKHQSDICKCIESGIMGKYEDLEGEVLQGVNDHLKRDADRAQELSDIFSGSEIGLAKRLWPRLNAVLSAKTGSFSHSANILMNTYLKDIPMNFGVHAGTEGWYGCQYEDDTMSEQFTCMPYGCFQEFIPVQETSNENPNVKLMHQLEVGQSYEVMSTNSCGMYRLRVGDAITVTGHRGNTPTYKFSHRVGQVLNLVYERTPENVLLSSVQNAQQALGDHIRIHSYTTTESLHLDKLTGESRQTPCYVYFIELDGKDNENTKLTDDQKQKFEDCLHEVHESYRDFRGQGSIGPAQVIQVKSGTFDTLRNVLTVPSQQFKVPRVLRKTEGLQCLLDNRLQ